MGRSAVTPRLVAKTIESPEREKDVILLGIGIYVVRERIMIKVINRMGRAKMLIHRNKTMPSIQRSVLIMPRPILIWIVELIVWLSFIGIR